MATASNPIVRPGVCDMTAEVSRHGVVPVFNNIASRSSSGSSAAQLGKEAYRKCGVYTESSYVLHGSAPTFVADAALGMTLDLTDAVFNNGTVTKRPALFPRAGYRKTRR
jgi:hypothetical protein